MPQPKERRTAESLANLRDNEVVVLGEENGMYLFSRNAKGVVRLNRRRSLNVMRSEIPVVRTTALELMEVRDALGGEEAAG